MCHIGNEIRFGLLGGSLPLDQIPDIPLHTCNAVGNVRELSISLDIQPGTKISRGNLLHCSGDFFNIAGSFSLHQKQCNRKDQNSK